MTRDNHKNVRLLLQKKHNSVLLFDHMQKCWQFFSDPVDIKIAKHRKSVLPVIEQCAHAVENHGLYAAGFIAYEAAQAFDPCLKVKKSDFPLVWFGLYKKPQRLKLPQPAGGGNSSVEWKSTQSYSDYITAIDHIKRCIAKGETYQVNYTIKLTTKNDIDPLVLFLQLVYAQGAGYGALIRNDEYTIVSASPELFFQLDGQHILSRPMKGTAPRGLWYEQDNRFADSLGTSAKDRAENVMIVDMVRNDLGKIAQMGSVHVSSLYMIEKYPTVWQMTSTVQAKTRADLSVIFRAAFPPASITGAPKPSTMKIIKELEKKPRKIYTGSIGYYAPERKAQFNVAIRTVLFDHKNRITEYGAGGGIVWDSVPEAEYRECLTKTKILSFHMPQFELLETVRWDPREGIFLLEEHLSRLSKSAQYFNYKIDVSEIRQRLLCYTDGLPRKDCMVRIRLGKQGESTFEKSPLRKAPHYRIRPARCPIDKDNPFLYHKTTNRRVYEQMLQEHPDFDDVLLWNKDGEITESCVANVVFNTPGGGWITPPVSSGLLQGTYRSFLLKQGLLEEKTIRIEELDAYSGPCLINSVRMMWKPVLVRR